MVQTDEERKAKKKAYRQTPEVKAKRKEIVKKYRARPEIKAKERARKQTSAYKKQQEEYKARPEVKAKRKEIAKKYRARPEVKAKTRAYSLRPENKAKTKDKREAKRLKVFQHYSKRLSNSDIPCCACCGENSHFDFLAIDHVIGRIEMDSIPELVALGYSSILKDKQLLTWIVEHDYLSDLKKEYFQILCHNCNFAKGIARNNNGCPMKNKPH